MAVREGLAFESPIESDCAPLAAPVAALLAAGLEVHCLRDLTRGGLATALIELAETRGLAIAVDERAIPVSEEVRGACEILGLEPALCRQRGPLRLLCAGRPTRPPRSRSSPASAPGGPPAVIGRVRASPTGRGHAAQRHRRRAHPSPPQRRAASANLLGRVTGGEITPRQDGKYMKSKRPGSVGRQRRVHVGRVGARVSSGASVLGDDRTATPFGRMWSADRGRGGARAQHMAGNARLLLQQEGRSSPRSRRPDARLRPRFRRAPRRR